MPAIVGPRAMSSDPNWVALHHRPKWTRTSLVLGVLAAAIARMLGCLLKRTTEICRVVTNGKRLGLIALGLGMYGAIPVSPAHATIDPNATFSFLQDGFTQEVWAVAETYPVGVVFASNGDVLTCYGGGHRFSANNTTLVHGSTIHTETTFASGCNGLGLTNHPNGFVYNNTFGGVTKLDPNNNLALVAGPYGQAGSNYGIATDPQTGNLVYVASDYSIHWVNADFTSSGVFSANSLGHGLIDQIAFDPTGNFLFLSGWGDHTLIVLHRDGSVAQVVPMSHQPDGIAFHTSNPQFVATNDTDGTLVRFDFPNNDFTQTPSQTVLGSGAGYGDHTGVGPDGCWYVSNGAVKYADGTAAGTGLVRICPGFQPPPGVGGAGVLAFGDSVAAGYGLGESDGVNNDNPSAYPALLATSLGAPYRNYAVAGACAETTDALYPIGNNYCSSATSVPEEITSADPTFHARVITLTVGADDIDFQGCLEAVVYGTYNQPTDPCAPTNNLPANLLAFGGSLNDDIAMLKSKYPGVPIVMTHYFNPFPTPPSSSQTPCALYTPLAAEYLVQEGNLGSIIGLLIDHNKFVDLERVVQAGIYGRAQYILGHLNAVIDQVAAGNTGVSTVGINFTGHDMCQGGGSWVFGPSLHGSAELDLGPFTKASLTFDFGPVPNACPDPNPALEQSASQYIPFGPLVKHGRQSGDVAYSFSTNCLPHPTRTGQQAIRDQVARKVPR
jgi:sugar lactone lactonase YvrE